MICRSLNEDRPGPAAAYAIARTVVNADVYRTDSVGDVVETLFVMGWVRPPDDPQDGPSAQDVLADLACPKCGGRDVHTVYQASTKGCGERCHPERPDQFAHRCRRCSYAWATHDFADER